MSLNHRVTQLEKAVHKLQGNAPREQDNTGVGPQSTSSEERNAIPQGRSSSSNLDPAPDSQQTQNPRKYSLEWWKICLEVVGIPFAIGYAIITGALWWDQHKNFQIDQRAWIGVDDISGVPEVNKPLIGRVVYRNSGRTPSKHTIILQSYLPVKKGEELTFTYNTTTDPSVGVIFPNTTYHQNFPTLPALSEDIDSITTEAVRIYVYGKITYEDIFSQPHWTTFCFYLLADRKGWAACKEYNDTDEK